MSAFEFLRNAKTACDEGLITSEDYDHMKKAFLRAQQIKAGMDAGFLREEDYRQARDSFLHSLDFALVGSSSAAPVPQSIATPVTGPSGANSPARQVSGAGLATAAIAVRHARGASEVQTSGANTPTARDAPAAAPPPAAAPAAPPPPPASRPVVPALVTFGSGGGAGTVPIPSDIPRTARASAAPGLAGKKSLSGIAVKEDCIHLFNQVKAKSTYKWISFRVNDEGNEVILDQAGDPNSTYEQFTAIFPENQCRYAVYDYAYLNADTQQTVHKLVFVFWSPDSSSTKARMMYASTKDFFKGFLDGVGADLQASNLEELAESEMRDKVHAGLTRK